MPATAYPFKIPMGMYKEQRVRLSNSLSKAYPSASHAALLKGGSEIPINSSDTTYGFRQESYFEYLFGYSSPDCLGAVTASGESIVFIPRLPSAYAVWMGELPTVESVRALLEVDLVAYSDEISATLLSKGITAVHVMKGINSDSGLEVLSAPADELNKHFEVIDTFLFHTLSEQRVFKTALEAEVLRYVCGVSSRAHIHVMQQCKPGMSQHQLESLFLHHVYFHGGCRRVSYGCICATGHHGAILHYPNNDAPVEKGTMALLDMGGEYRCYASDITCSYPVDGVFTPEQRLIYNAVLEAHDAVLRSMGPGVSWVDMHKLALRVLCKHLLAADILRGATVDELMSLEAMRIFLPHGLGHLIGLDVHDVGGYLSTCPSRPTASDCCKLRTARNLEPNMYVTVEPGCYFNQILLTQAFADPALKPYFNEDLIRSKYWNFGGVRIESDVLVTPYGAINFTVVPRTVEEIEATMRGEHFMGEVATYTK